MVAFPDCRIWFLVGTAALINSFCFAQSLPELAPEIVFTVQGEGQNVMVRALTRATACPAVSWDEQPHRRMDVRAAAATPALRGDNAQQDSKPSVFEVLTCEAKWPKGAQRGRIAGQDVPQGRARRDSCRGRSSGKRHCALTSTVSCSEQVRGRASRPDRSCRCRCRDCAALDRGR